MKIDMRTTLVMCGLANRPAPASTLRMLDEPVMQLSPNLSLNWKSFNIAAQETVGFQQPSASAVAVNRIFDTNDTRILAPERQQTGVAHQPERHAIR